MTCAAPIERTSPALRVLHTPVTSAPSAAAIWTAYVPTPPAAPLTSTRCPARTAPTSRIPRRAVPPAIGTAAACSKVGVGQPQDLRRAEPLLDNRLHQVSSCRRALLWWRR